MAWPTNPRPAKSLLTLRDQINARWPHRSKDSDGTIGDSAHSSRTSDHNPNDDGVVCAIDITHDLANGVDAGVISEALRVSRDPRVKYIIWNRRIASAQDNWAWRNYSGSNPHTRHFHLSVKSDKADDARPWPLEGVKDAPPAPAGTPQPVRKPVLREGSKGEAVKELQRLLGFSGHDVDGDFGPKTKAAVEKRQTAAHIFVDGIVGPYTWKILNAR